MKERMVVVVMALCFVCGVTRWASAADEMPGLSPFLLPKEARGLIGIQYGSEDFTDAEDLVRLSSLDQTWGVDDGFGKQWAGKWQGFIIGPATGEIRFTVETDQQAKIEIAGKVVLDSKGGLTAGSMKMVKGRKYPIVLTYVEEGS